MLKPTIGYGIQGAIWYQGESNAGRAYQYRDLFPLMIQSWRDEWGIGDFPFYWVQLADFLAEKPEPGDSAWAELREAQTMTMSRLPNTGEAVIIDLGEAQDIHPRNKQDVAKRLARWALARDYGVNVPYQSPTYKSMEKQGNKVVADASTTSATGSRPFDVPEVRGFTIAGERQEVRHGHGEGRRQGQGRGLVGRGLRPGRRPLRLGRQPRLQPLQHGRPPRHPVPDRRLAGRDGRALIEQPLVGSAVRTSLLPADRKRRGPHRGPSDERMQRRNVACRLTTVALAWNRP